MKFDLGSLRKYLSIIALLYFFTVILFHLFQNIEIKFNLFTDIFGWGALEAIGTTLAFFAVIYSIIEVGRQHKEQLKREQKPFVGIKKFKIISSKNSYEFAIHNVGRGPALGIIGDVNMTKSNKGFFADSCPHSYYLSPGEIENSEIDAFRLDDMESSQKKGEKYYYFYLFYSDQLRNEYRTKVVLKRRVVDKDNKLPDVLVVMENMRDEI